MVARPSRSYTLDREVHAALALPGMRRRDGRPVALRIARHTGWSCSGVEAALRRLAARGGEPAPEPDTPRLTTPEQQQIATDYVPFARKLARPYKRRWPREWQAWDSAALYGLTVAAAKYDPEVPIPFATFARTYIRGALADEVRTLFARRVIGSDRAVEPTDRTADLEEAGRRLVLATPDRTPDDAAAVAELAEVLLRRLPPVEATLLRAVYCDGLELTTDAARVVGVGGSWACRLHARALARLRAEAV